MKGRRLVHALVTSAAVALRGPWAVAASDVQVPAGCGDAAAFESELRQRVGAHAEDVLATTHVRIEPEGELYRLTMRVGDEARIIRDPSCHELFVAAVVVAAAFAEGTLQRGVPAGAPPSAAPSSGASSSSAAPPAPSSGTPVSASLTPPSVPPQNNSAPPSPPPAEPEAPARRVPLAFGIGAGIGSSFGFLPKPSLAAELVASLHVGAWGVAARGRYFASSETRDAQGRGVSVQAAGAELAGFWIGWNVLELRAGMSARAAFGTGLGSPATNTDTVWALGAVAGVRWYALTLRDTTLVLGADGTVDPSPPRFEIEQYAEVFHASTVDGAIFLGVEQVFR